MPFSSRVEVLIRSTPDGRLIHKETCEVVYDSIIENKSKIKSYWEQMMLAAELASQQLHTPPTKAQPTKPKPQPMSQHQPIHSPDLSEAEFYDAVSNTTVQTPDLDKEAESVKENETVVERDIRIQQERELALMIERQKALKSMKTPVATREKEDDVSRTTHQQHDEAYLSIPTTDEGNFSEYGSEDKEDPSPDESRVTSPIVPVGMSSHHRTQSMDSMSSGHSSGSHSDHCLSRPDRRQNGGLVKPHEEPQKLDILSYVKYEKETPIEREIRLARQREEELRREKKMSASFLTNSQCKTDSNAKPQIERTVRKPKISPVVVIQNGDIPKSVNPVNDESKSLNITKPGGATPKIYIQNPQQKGLMKRFLASRGKMGSSPNSCQPSPVIKTPATPPSSISEPFFSFTSLVQNKGREEPVNLGARPGYKSAEDKIQSELQEMKRREEELRQQRRSNLYSARSQPDLLNIAKDFMNERDTKLDADESVRMPVTSKLRSALSMQNILDVDEKIPPRRNPKRKSALIEHWENRIQNTN